MESRDEQRVEQWLDKALAEYGSAEPRAGLENRVLANVRAGKGSVPIGHGWWLVAGALAASAIVTAVWLGNRSGVTPKHPLVENARVAQAPSPAPGTADASSPAREPGKAEAAGEGARTTPHRTTPHRSTPQGTASQRLPKLEQFPSPQPLSDEEEQLVRYVRENHAHAVLLAQAQTELLNREREEELLLQGPPAVGRPKSDQPER